jgi:hypothetical protein
MTKKEKWIHFLDIIEKLVIILGFPFAIWQYKTATDKEKYDRDYEVYNSLDNKYIEWQNLCLAHPYLDISDIKDSISPKLNLTQEKEEVILFSILFSLFERAYLLYNKESNPMMQGQWEGWDEYIDTYCQRKNFREIWIKYGYSYDPNFTNYMNEKIKNLPLQ